MMKDIKMVEHMVVSALPSRIEIEMVNRYTPRHLLGEKEVRSRVIIELDEDGKILKVLDTNNGKLPQGKLAEVRFPSSGGEVRLTICGWIVCQTRGGEGEGVAGRYSEGMLDGIFRLGVEDGGGVMKMKGKKFIVDLYHSRRRQFGIP